MAYNLTDEHKDVLRWMVREKRSGTLGSEFTVNWQVGGYILDYRGEDQPEITRGALDLLAASGLIYATPRTLTKTSSKGTVPWYTSFTSARRTVNSRGFTNLYALVASARDGGRSRNDHERSGMGSKVVPDKGCTFCTKMTK